MVTKNIYIVYILILILVSCSNDPFPVNKIYLIDQKLKTCDQYILADKETLKFKHDKTLDYDSCPISFGYTKEDTGKLMSWIRRLKNKIGE